MCETLKLSEPDRCLNVMPLYHIHGFSALLATLTGRGAFVCWPAFYAPAFFAALEQWRPTWYTAAPAIHRSLLDRAPAHAELIRRHPLRFVRSASGPMPVAWIAEMERCCFHRSLWDDGDGAPNRQQSASSRTARAGFGGPAGRSAAL